tara:strand:+ start:7058 stop:7573 length:516 start_codon:yes stop_codon:yes gene_type:complete
LGDAVLNTVVSECLYISSPQNNEGSLSQKRSVIVGRDNLNKIGEKLIPKELIKHKLKTISKNIYGNILESLIAAIYLDLGYKKTRVFIEKNILTDKEVNLKHYNYKSKILEWSQKNQKKIRFVNSKQAGPDHQKQYLVHLYIDKVKISESWGKTKKSAEQRASKIAIKVLN